MAAVFSMTLFAAQAEEGSFELSITGLRELDQTFEQIKQQGLGTWASNKVSATVREEFPTLFGPQAESVEKVVMAGEHTYGLQANAMDTVRGMMGAESSAEVTQRSDEFWGWVSGEKLPEMAKDVVPDSVRGVVEGAEQLADGAAWVAEKGQQAIDAATSMGDQLKEYFSEGTDYGLEPGGDDASVMAAAREAKSEPLVPDPEVVAEATVWVDENPQVVAAEAAGEPALGELEREEQFGEPVIADARPSEGRRSEPIGGAFADDIAALERDVGGGGNRTGSSFDADLDMLAADLGIDADAASRKKTDWVDEAARAETESRAWELEQARKMEEQRQLDALRRQQEQLARQARLDAEAAQAAAERERRSSYADTSSSNSSSKSGWGSLLGAVVVGAAQGYLLGKHGISTTAPSGYRGSSSGGSGSSNCSVAQSVYASYETCMEQALRSNSNCNRSRITQRCANDAAANLSSCPSYAQQLREIAASAAESARSFCAN